MTSLSWQQLIFYIAAIIAFVVLVVFGHVDITAALTAIGFLFGHGAATVASNGAINGGNNATESKTTSAA